METTLYYFTGTGNSLWAARQLALTLDNASLIPIAKIWREQRIVPKCKSIGILHPLYFQGTPDIVLRFVEKLSLDDTEFIFAVCTRGVTGGIVFKQLNRILETKGKRLNFATYLTMHDNYIVNFDAPSPERAQRIGRKALTRIVKIAEIVKRREDGNSRDPLIGSIMGSVSYPGWIKDVHVKDREFWTDDRCNSCGTCVKVCPVVNIEMAEGKPSWLHRCQQCFACIHLCPRSSIQIGKKTLRRTRYRHPEVSVKDIIAQKG